MEMNRHQATTSAERGRLRGNLEEFAARAAQVQTDAEDNPGRSAGLDDNHLATIADSIYHARRRRLELFDASLFAEPAWDMLLILFIKKARGEQVFATSLYLAAGIPKSTGLRWISQLQEQGLLHRFGASGDARAIRVELTPEGYRRMRRYVTEGTARFVMPLPDRSPDASDSPP